jgi:hypothetical protein
MIPTFVQGSISSIHTHQCHRLLLAVASSLINTHQANRVINYVNLLKFSGS